MSDLAVLLSVIGTTFAIGATLYGAYRRSRPSVRRAAAAIDALVGTEPVTDRSGQIIEPGQPGLVHRVTTVEEAVVEFRHVIGLYTETQKRIDHIDGRVKQLEDSRVDRLISQVESANMWRAVADNAAPEEPQ